MADRRTVLDKVVSETLSDKVYNAIRLSILRDDFPPGYTLCIEDLATELGVSTTPVREALARLSGDGLVDLEPNKKPIVASISRDEITHLYSIRRLLEPYFARLLMREMRKDAALRKPLLKIRDDIERILDRLDTLPTAPQFYVGYMKIDHRLQEVVTQAKDVGMIGRLSALINNYVYRLRMFSKETPLPQRVDRMRVVCKEHLRILDGLLEGDSKAVDKAIVEHLTLSEIRSLRALEETPSKIAAVGE